MTFCLLESYFVFLQVPIKTSTLKGNEFLLQTLQQPNFAINVDVNKLLANSRSKICFSKTHQDRMVFQNINRTLKQR